MVLIAIATVLAFFALFAVWANRQLLDTDNWTDTSTRLLQERSHWTLPLGLAQFRGLFQTNWPALTAVVVMATIRSSC